MTMVIELGESNFKNEITDFPGVAVVDFWAPWCGPCKMMGPVVDKISEKFTGKVKFAKINVDDNQNLSAQFKIMSIPSILFFKNGSVVHTHVGATNETDLENQVNQHLL
ncbi:thioredoxin [bacterium]|nr:thioredoxin [bacterium]